MTATTTPDSIVREVILEKNLTPHSYIRLLSFALGCMKEIDLDVTGKVESTTLTVDAFRRIKLPCDYVDWVRVGSASGPYVLNMGETSTFNRKLKLGNGTYVPRESVPDAETIAWLSTQNFWYPYYDGFKHSGGTKLDEFMYLGNGLMQLSNGYNEGDEIDFDYIAFDKTNPKTEIHKYAESTIKAWIEYKWVCGMPKTSPYEKNAALQMYVMEYGKLRARKNNLTKETIMRAKSRYQKQL